MSSKRRQELTRYPLVSVPLQKRTAASRKRVTTMVPADGGTTDDASPHVPATRRGRESRSRVLDAARTVFEQKGFVDARVRDIVDIAGMSQGSFYSYWKSKHEVFKELTETLAQEQYAALSLPSIYADPHEKIAEANRRFLDSYRTNARFIATIEQVCTIDEEVRLHRLEVRRRATSRLAGEIRRLQVERRADPLLDPTCTAKALISMVTHFAYMWLAMGEHEDDDRANATLTALWVQALKLSAAPQARGDEIRSSTASATSSDASSGSQ